MFGNLRFIKEIVGGNWSRGHASPTLVRTTGGFAVTNRHDAVDFDTVAADKIYMPAGAQTVPWHLPQHSVDKFVIEES